MKNEIRAGLSSVATTSAAAPQLQTLMGQLPLALELHEMKLGDALSADLAERLRQRCQSRELTPAVEVAAAVQCWLDLADNRESVKPGAELPPPPKMPRPSRAAASGDGRRGSARQARERRLALMNVFMPNGVQRERPTFAPMTFGVSDATFNVDVLAHHLAFLLSNEGAFFGEHILSGDKDKALFDDDDDLGSVKRGEWAEWLSVCGDIAESDHDEWQKCGSDLPALGCFVRLDGQSLLYGLAQAFGPHAPALAEIAAKKLPPADACALAEALAVLEDVAHQWCGLATDHDGPGLPRVLVILGELRVETLRKRIMAHAA